jgi:hypothetical protein
MLPLNVNDLQLSEDVQRTLRTLKTKGFDTAGRLYTVQNVVLGQYGLTLDDLVQVLKVGVAPVADKEGKIHRDLTGILTGLSQDKTMTHFGLLVDLTE